MLPPLAASGASALFFAPKSVSQPASKASRGLFRCRATSSSWNAIVASSPAASPAALRRAGASDSAASASAARAAKSSAPSASSPPKSTFARPPAETPTVPAPARILAPAPASTTAPAPPACLAAAKARNVALQASRVSGSLACATADLARLKSRVRRQAPGSLSSSQPVLKRKNSSYDCSVTCADCQASNAEKRACQQRH